MSILLNDILSFLYNKHSHIFFFFEKDNRLITHLFIMISHIRRISANLKSFVYCAGIRVNDDNDWYTVWNRFLYTDLHTEQELLLNALGCTKNPQLINKWVSNQIIYISVFNIRF